MAVIEFFRFSNAWAAWLAPMIALLMALLLLEARRRAALLRAFGDADLVAGVSRLGPGWARRLRSLSLALALIGVLAALARPVRDPRSGAHDRGALDIVLLLDVSRSMGAEDYGPKGSRLARAKVMILEALPDLAGRRVGIVTFAGAAFPQAPLTSDHTALRYVLTNWVFIESAPAGGSDLVQGIRTATRLFGDRPGERVVLLFSDGAESGESLEAALAEARSKAIRIFAFGLGHPVPSPIPEYGKDHQFAGWLTVNGTVATTRLDEDGLKGVAAATRGGYARVVSGREFEWTLSRAGLVSASPPGEIQELFQWPLAAAVLLLLLERGSVRLTGWRLVGARSSPARPTLTT